MTAGQIPHDAGWDIPYDTDVENWRCIRLAWPEGDDWSDLLKGLLYTLTRGRAWDKTTGVIKDAQGAAWQIFDANWDLTPCVNVEDGGSTGNEALIGGTGGALIVESDEMGQVVTNVEFDAATGELKVFFGKCCWETYHIGSGGVILDADGEVIQEEVVTPTYPPGVVPPTVFPEYTACGKASYFVERLEAIGRAAWNNRNTPLDALSGIQAANPGYSVSGVAVTTLWLNMVALSAIEALADTDIFNSEFFRDLKCYIMRRTDDGEEKFMSTTEWGLLVLGWLNSYPFTSENLDVDVVGDITVSSFWSILIQQVLKYERCNQIAAESLGTTYDCDDCGDGYGIPNDPWSAYDWVIEYDFTAGTGGWSIGQDYHDPGVGMTGTDDWWSGSALDDLHSPQSVGVKSGAILRIEVDIDGGSLAAPDNLQGALTLARLTGGDYTIATIEQMIAQGWGTHEYLGLWNYNEVADGALQLMLTHQAGNTGSVRTVVSRIKIGGIGDQPFPDLV